MSTPFVDRCCCADVRFRDLKRVADTTGTPLEVLIRETGCGAGCGLCAPYLRVMVRTGQTEIPLMSPDDLRAMAEHQHPACADRPVG